MKSRSEYEAEIHKLGRKSNLIGLILMISVPTLVAIITKTSVDVILLLTTLVPIATIWWMVSIFEMLATVPMLGSAGSYLAVLSGNVSNIKLPAALNAQNIVGTKSGSEEADVISTLSIASSTIANTLVLIVALLFVKQIIPILENDLLKPGFDNILPALVGALSAPFILKTPRLFIIPIVYACIIFLFIMPNVPSAMSALLQSSLLIQLSLVVLISTIIGKKRRSREI